jgi:protein TonB
MTTRTLSATALAIALSAGPAIAADDVATVKSLYASAAYEDALAMLDRVRGPEHAVFVEEYRALCHLALGRTAEAERSLALLLTRQPTYEPKASDVSPRLVELFRAVRKRTLPAIARALYERAKASFDAGQYGDAAFQFKQVTALAAGGQVDAAQVDAVHDLRQLAEGFLRLAETELVKRDGAAPLLPPSAADIRPSASSAAVAVPARPMGVARIYTTGDEGVLPPVVLERTLPPWTPTNSAQRNATFRGILEIVVDERGLVESAVLATSISPLYDAALIEASAGWRFRPATKDGRAVKYRKALEIVLRPAAE